MADPYQYLTDAERAAYENWKALPNGPEKNFQKESFDKMLAGAQQRADQALAQGQLPGANGLPAGGPAAAPYEGNNVYADTGTPGRPGIDTRPYEYVRDPTAFMYGGERGAADRELQRYDTQAAMSNAAYNRSYSQFGQSQDQAQGARNNQLQGLGYLQQQIEGKGPSVAQVQQDAGLASARNQQASIAASARGGGANLAAAQQASANAAAGLSGQAVQNSALLRAQEQQSAMNAYGQQAAGLRGADMQNSNAYLAQQGLASQRNQQAEGNRQNIYQSQMAAKQAGENQNAATMSAERGLNYQQQKDAADRSDRNVGTALQVAGSLAGLAVMASDKNLKANIKSSGRDVDEAMGALRPYSYDYKDEKYGSGKQTGIMAQHLMKSKAGKGVVAETPEGLMVKLPQATGLALAGIARLDKRLRAVEGAR